STGSLAAIRNLVERCEFKFEVQRVYAVGFRPSGARCLTALFWKWSGMATLGLAYLILAAPILTLGLAVALYRRPRISSYHTAAFWMSVGYVPCLLLLYAARIVYYGLPG